jgi:hypothetical protein
MCGKGQMILKTLPYHISGIVIPQLPQEICDSCGEILLPARSCDMIDEALDKHKKQEMMKITEGVPVTITFNGSKVSDRELEGVLFDISIIYTNGQYEIGVMSVQDKFVSHFEKQNQILWLERIRDYVQRHVEDLLDEEGYDLPNYEN